MGSSGLSAQDNIGDTKGIARGLELRLLPPPFPHSKSPWLLTVKQFRDGCNHKGLPGLSPSQHSRAVLWFRTAGSHSSKSSWPPEDTLASLRLSTQLPLLSPKCRGENHDTPGSWPVSLFQSQRPPLFVLQSRRTLLSRNKNISLNPNIQTGVL